MCENRSCGANRSLVVHGPLHPVSGPRSSPLQSTQAQSPSIKDIGSPQMGQSGGGPLSSLGRMGSSMSSSSITSPGGALVHFRYLPFSWAHFQLQGFFCALAAWHTDKRQPPVDDGGRYCPNRMAIGKFLAIRSRNIDFTIRKTVLHAQLLPEAFGRRTSATARGDEQCDVRHRISVRGRDESVIFDDEVDLNTAGKGGARSEAGRRIAQRNLRRHAQQIQRMDGRQVDVATGSLLGSWFYSRRV